MAWLIAVIVAFVLYNKSYKKKYSQNKAGVYLVLTMVGVYILYCVILLLFF